MKLTINVTVKLESSNPSISNARLNAKYSNAVLYIITVNGFVNYLHEMEVLDIFKRRYQYKDRNYSLHVSFLQEKNFFLSKPQFS